MNAPSIDEAEFRRAGVLLREGKLEEADAACRGMLAIAPRNAAVMHLLGLIRKDSGDVVAGERLMRESIALEPARAEFRINLANLCQRLGRLPEAERGYREALALDQTNRFARLGLVRTLNDLGQHAAAEAECRALVAGHRADPQAWSALATTLQNQNRLSEAEAAYRQATTIDPGHSLAQHNLGSLLGRTGRAEEALEALSRAEGLGVKGFELAFNKGQALLQLYRIEEAEQAFAEAVSINPLQREAQINLARIRFMRGDPNFARAIAAAAAAHRDDVGTQLLFAEVLHRAGDLQSAESLLRDLLARKGPLPEVRWGLAAILQEAGRLKEAEDEALEAATARPENAAIVQTLVAILLSRGRPKDAASFIRAQRLRQPEEQGWIAYEATAARLLDEPLYRELYDYRRLVQTYDLEPPSGWSSMAELNSALTLALDARHQFATHPLDQSLRNGSQTARSLLTERDPAIKAILKAFEAPIESYRRAMGTDPAHPLSARNRGAARIAGAWSVQLRREGFHVNHFHPEGWISSAYYVSLPEEVNDTTLMSGWIKFGEPRYPVPEAQPELFVRPRPGRLVLFPSYMWHGTNPIHGTQPRTAIAFDAVPPPQSA